MATMEMKFFFVSFVLAIWGRAARCAVGNLSVSKLSLEFAMTDDDDTEMELSSQLQEVNERSSGWSPWSDWSLCSRSCDGGTSQQIRSCKNGPCRGDHVRYKICNMQPCPDSSIEFREEQCAKFNPVPYEEAFYEWRPFYDEDEPCSLTCKGKPRGADDDDAILIVARLKDKVHDGTRCRPGSLDMCIDGKCQRVGCDLRIGSLKQVDGCGVCGGDGSSCSRPLYHWTLTYASLCSATCGGGYKMSRPVCQNRVTGDEVEEELCNDSQKPDSTVAECNTHSCPPKWYAGDWGPCSVSCGGGSKLRQVHCVEETNNTKIRVDDSECAGQKPWHQEPCNNADCPTWFTTKWSGCSVSCGEGVQVRGVECRDSDDQPSSLCDARSKPESTQVCSTGMQCPFQLDTSDELMPGLYHTQPLMQPYPPPPVPERLVGEQLVPSESTDYKVYFACGWVYVRFIPDEWGPCSATCGEGVRKREVHCKIFLEFSRTIAKLPDKQCSGIKPIEIEKCYREPCMNEKHAMDIKDDPRSDNIKVGSGSPAKSYSWKEQGFTHCSASCLGGVQELIVNCVRDDNQKVTSPFMCPIELKPEAIVRSCNEHSCPPRWTYTEFSPCSQSCGMGIQTRDVTCIHELTQGGSNTIVVPNNRCPQPPPLDRQFCNVLDCPVRWKVSEWSRCTEPCGGGEKTRKVECKQIMAQNHTVDRPPNMCPSPKPLEKKPCNTKGCVVETDKPDIDVMDNSYVQKDPKKKKISIKVGGSATLFYGTTVKIKCPVKKYDRAKILWKKDNALLPQNKKFKSSKKGALRVQSLSYSDSGVYTCVAGKSAASIKISVTPKPGEFHSSEEIQRLYKTEIVSDVDMSKTKGTPVFADDYSHEQRPDGTKKKFTKLFTPTTVPSLRLENMNHPNPEASTPSDVERHQDKALNLPSSTSEFLSTTDYESTRSSATRPTPNFLPLISKLQSGGGTSRGHRMVVFPPDYEVYRGVDEDVRSLAEREPKLVEDTSSDNARLDWIIDEWSRCSETCGGNGFQVRAIRCTMTIRNITHHVENGLCEDAGLKIPDTSRKCGFEECPRWIASEWGPCGRSKCFARHKALQKRTISCQTSLNQTVDMTRCDASRKPIQTQECYHQKCVGKWKVGPWSDCSASCDGKGEKFRIIQCVWYGTKKPAGTACIDLTRPSVRKSCKGPPCSNSTVEICEDHSMFCSNVKVLKMCKIVRYKQQCCQSCAED
ncbi:protein madd-4 isoform X2 [Cylas formicarius]|uniref:protein madd-4 isoform X2 n=1 Tax=Cylas formicarius TaxID=197179 RepID=UPI0029584E53|nr:protein madd-4 isoform X2 [Cylas formicarius]